MNLDLSTDLGSWILVAYAGPRSWSFAPHFTKFDQEHFSLIIPVTLEIRGAPSWPWYSTCTSRKLKKGCFLSPPPSPLNGWKILLVSVTTNDLLSPSPFPHHVSIDPAGEDRRLWRQESDVANPAPLAEDTHHAVGTSTGWRTTLDFLKAGVPRLISCQEVP